MSQLLYLIPILLLCSSLLSASVSRVPVVAEAIFAAPQLTVAVRTPTLAAGEQQTLQVQVDQSAERQATLVLVVTYPNGQTARTVYAVRGRNTLLTWVVPVDVGRGKASFTLAAAGCGCDQQGTVPPPLKLDSTVNGIFYIAVAPSTVQK